MLKKIFFSSVLLLIGGVALQAQTGKSLELDGISQYMRIPNHDDFNIKTTESFTVSAWINMAQYSSTMARFVAKRSQSTTLADKSGWEIWGGQSATNFCAANTPNAANNHNNSISAWTTDATAALNTWVHFALVIDRTNGKMYEYLNGVERANSGTKDISPWAGNNPYDVFVGAGITGTYPTQTAITFFKGKLDNVRIWKKALSPAEIVSDKTSEVSSATPGLVAAYDFETVTNGVVADITGNHPATLVNFPVEGPVTITTATVEQDKNFTGKGNKNELLLKATLSTSGTLAADLQKLVFNLEGTTRLASVDSVKVYTTGSVNKFDSRNPAAVLLGKLAPASGELTVNLTGKLGSGTHFIWITADIAADAPEGAKVDASVTSITTSNQTFVFASGNPAGSREVLLARTLVFAPGDYNSTNYRIPALITADDGALVTLTDKRKFNSTDLPEDIDVVCRRSTDGGRTWTEPVTVAKGTGRFAGYGDAILTKAKSGRLIAVYVGGPGLGQSTSTNPIRTYVSYSSDHGKTWSSPRDITYQLWGADCTDPVRSKWQASFCGAGQGLTTRTGRIMVVGTVREVAGGALNNYAYYSDDEGENWSVSTRAIAGGDEAKVVELNNGNILMSSRASGNRLWAVSADGGQTWGARNSWTDLWGNACNGDMIRYTSTMDGFDKDRILHTLPNASNRTNLSVFMSYNEGTSWAVKKTICEGTSAYASLAILPDGTIGVYTEEDESVPYKMYFLNFSVNWLTNGADQYFPAGTPVVEKPVFSVEAGTLTDDKEVVISTATEGAVVYYTTDGSMPNAGSTVYSQSIIINRTMVVKAVAMKEGMAPSLSAEATYVYGWALPGDNRATIAQRYLVTASTTGASVELDYKAPSVPATYFVSYNDQVITVKPNSEFTLNLEALKGQTDGLQWCQAIVLADWNRDFDFSDEGERIALIGSRSTNNGDAVLSIAQKIGVPATAIQGKRTRLRVVYTDGWRPTSYTDAGFDPVDKGRVYEFDLLVSDLTSTVKTFVEQLVFSNPVADQLALQLDDSDYSVSIVDLTGKKRYETTTRGGQLTIAVGHLPAQVYLLRLVDNQGEVTTHKFIKL